MSNNMMMMSDQIMTCPDCGGPVYHPGIFIPEEEVAEQRYCWRCGWGHAPNPARFVAVADPVDRGSLPARWSRLRHQLMSRRDA